MELASTTITKGRRYIFDGSRVVTERLFYDESSDPYQQTDLERGKSRLERVYVVGSILFCAIDSDGDGELDNDLNDFNEECLWQGGLETLHCSDAAFYYYTDASGRVAALGDSHPDNSHKILEYYRYRAFGEMVTLPVVDEPTVVEEEEEIPADGIEDTPSSLTDNNAYMLTLRGTYGSFVGRVSFWGNGVVLENGLRIDPEIGAYWDRGWVLYWVDWERLEPILKKRAEKRRTEDNYWKGTNNDIGWEEDNVPPIEVGPCEEIEEIGPILVQSDPKGPDKVWAAKQGFTKTINAAKIAQFIEELRQLVTPCKCIKELVILMHGPTYEDAEGGFYTGSTNDDSVEGKEDAKLFGGKIKGALCKNATLKLLACKGMAKDFGKHLAEAIGNGVTVIGSEGKFETSLTGSSIYNDGKRTIRTNEKGEVTDNDVESKGGKHVDGAPNKN